ncbi:MAG: sterol desaturase family protein [Pseudomonadota bacterium]
MTPDTLERIGAEFEGALILIGLAMLAIEILKGIFTGGLKGRGVLDMVASLSTQIPYLLVEIFLMSALYVGFIFVGEALAPWALPITVWTAALALLACDFTYYWEHRLAHRVRLLWTQHAVHHSSREMNILVGLRFGPLESFASAVMHFPLILIGFPPELVFFGILVVLAYQTWIHTELIGKLGPLDAVLNTPANHRVHHGCDDKYIDKNYGGVLIIWDRLFGTFQREEETPRYGLKRDFDSVNPVAVWFSELPGLARDVANAKSVGEGFMRLFGPPDWTPDPTRSLRQSERDDIVADRRA